MTSAWSRWPQDGVPLSRPELGGAPARQAHPVPGRGPVTIRLSLATPRAHEADPLRCLGAWPREQSRVSCGVGSHAELLSGQDAGQLDRNPTPGCVAALTPSSAGYLPLCVWYPGTAEVLRQLCSFPTNWGSPGFLCKGILYFTDFSGQKKGISFINGWR